MAHHTPGHQPGGATNQGTPTDMQRCIQACADCSGACLSAVHHCLQRGGEHAAAGHVRPLLDCAEICQTSANFMRRDSDLHPHTCAACAEVCARCADDCEALNDDPVMRQCAAACRSCAESCRRMASQ